ncbi:uncharacterized protein LOC122400634 [Colletes gigas]|uniref:uncharacterized protein LOC122400634 n=1 Tax=Colletes gigas TaxID=935657 RepID=UPI001C9A8934|nr:uncharacterized protein LOC122400634 [Colletes gigas]
MHFSLIVILCASIFACQVLSENNTYEYSDQHPWPVVYGVYPYYNTETLLKVWNTDKALDVSTNIVTLVSDEQVQKIYSDDIQHNDTHLLIQNNVPYFISEVKNINEEQLSPNKQYQANYANSPKEAKSSKCVTESCLN